jgi:hypothetical protein
MEQAASSAGFKATFREGRVYHERIMTSAATRTRKNPGYTIQVLPAKTQLVG